MRIETTLHAYPYAIISLTYVWSSILAFSGAGAWWWQASLGQQQVPTIWAEPKVAKVVPKVAEMKRPK
eukprot:4741724-Amphidinium_carterae.1